MPGLVARVSLEEGSQVRERRPVDRIAHALAERRQGDEPQHVAAEPLDDGDERQQANQRHGDAVPDEQSRLRRARKMRRDGGSDRREDGVHLARREARLPDLDGRRAPEGAGRDVASLDEAPVAGNAVQHERSLVGMVRQDLLPAVRVAHGESLNRLPS